MSMTLFKVYSQAANLSNELTEHSQQSQIMSSIDRRRMETIEESVRQLTTDLRTLREGIHTNFLKQSEIQVRHYTWLKKG